MMAFDRSSGAPSLDPGLVAELRQTLSRSIATGNHGDELRGLLTRAAGDARSKGLQAEQLLVALKDIWYHLPQVSSQQGTEPQTRLLQQLIARCIQEYYAN